MPSLLERLSTAPHVLIGVALALASGHLGLAVLHLTGRAAPVIEPTRWTQLVPAVDGWWWVVIHTIAAVLLAVAALLDSPAVGIRACVLSMVAWASWAGLLAWWSMDTEPPVSLTAPLLGAVLALVAGVCSLGWAGRHL